MHGVLANAIRLLRLQWAARPLSRVSGLSARELVQSRELFRRLGRQVDAAVSSHVTALGDAIPPCVRRRSSARRASPPAMSSPSASNAAPTRPCSAKPGCPTPPASPGWATGPCATSSAELAASRLGGSRRCRFGPCGRRRRTRRLRTLPDRQDRPARSARAELS
jgi:hypothetical protein